MTGTQQLAFDLPARPALAREEFFVSPANRLALAQLDAWPDWPEQRMAVTGPAGSGKTHLAHVWAKRAEALLMSASELAATDPLAVASDAALVVEDCDAIAGSGPAEAAVAEERLFHICNRLRAGGGSLMVTGILPPAGWGLALPDLISRLQTAGVARLEPPDDALLSAVMVKMFTDRQLEVGPDLIGYLLDRMDRSFDAARRMVARLDQAALAGRRRVSVRLASDLFRTGELF